MIVVSLMGGLGNQMFQYAMGRSLAYRVGTELKLDLAWFAERPTSATSRSFELNAFRIHASPATRNEVEQLRRSRGGKFSSLARQLNPYRTKTFIEEKGFAFDPSVMGLPDNVFLKGYWQSEKYFQDIVNLLLTEFYPINDLNQEARVFEEAINASNSVSLHVRRGDYVTSTSARVFHGTCPISYYLEAATFVIKKATDAQFFLFSDDPKWVKDNFDLPFQVTVIEVRNPRSAWEDMYLMSRCRHHIIANSTFSWWGAWLNRNPDKMVIAPRHWFADTSIDTSDLIPSSWIRL